MQEQYYPQFRPLCVLGPMATECETAMKNMYAVANRNKGNKYINQKKTLKRKRTICTLN